MVQTLKRCGSSTGGGIETPRYLDVELTNCCNFQCCFCPTGTRSMNRMRGYMQPEVVEAICDNVKKYDIPGVRFIRWGEPTLHPEYIEILKKIKSTGTLIHINTNGSLITSEQMRALVDMGLDSIKFSFQGADEGTYNEMRQGGEYSKLLGIIKEFNQIRGDLDFPFIQISTTLTSETDGQIESFKHDVEGLCDYYNIGYTQLDHLSVKDMNVNDEQKRKIEELQARERQTHTRSMVCPEAFDKLSINWNGDVTLCCSDYDNFMVIGNILDSDLKQLFTSRAAEQYRKVVAAGEYDKIRCCKYCYELIPLNR